MILKMALIIFIYMLPIYYMQKERFSPDSKLFRVFSIIFFCLLSIVSILYFLGVK